MLRRTLQAADENNLPFLASALSFGALLALAPFVVLLAIGLSHAAEWFTPGTGPEVGRLVERFLPPHATAEGANPFAFIEALVAGIAENRGRVSLVAIPLFIWFSTRLFAGIRTALNEIYDVSARPPRRRHFLVAYLLGKVRDVVMVLATLALFLLNSAASLGLTLLWVAGEARAPEFGFLFTTLGRLSAEAVGLVFSVALFVVLYRFAAARPMPWRSSLLASVFAALAFEVAKRLFGLWLQQVATVERLPVDSSLATIVFFVLWVYYTAFVFLLGGVVAGIWELRRRTEHQRAQFG